MATVSMPMMMMTTLVMAATAQGLERSRRPFDAVFIPDCGCGVGGGAVLSNGGGLGAHGDGGVRGGGRGSSKWSRAQ